MNKFCLYFKGTWFFWVYCWNDKWSKATAKSHDNTVRLCVQYHSILVGRIGLTEEKKCQLLMQHLSFILANCSVLGKQRDPAAVWGPGWYYCPWGQHHLTVKISSSTRDCSSCRQSKRFFNPLLFIIVLQAVLLRVGALLAIETWGQALTDRERKIQQFHLHLAVVHTHVKTHTVFPQTHSVMPAEGITLFVLGNLNIESV